jgi:hypothetical protein
VTADQGGLNEVKFIPVAAATSLTKSSTVVRAILRHEKKYSFFSLGPLHGQAPSMSGLVQKLINIFVEANVHILRHQLWYIMNEKCRSVRHGVLGLQNPFENNDIESVHGGIENLCRANGQEIDPINFLDMAKPKRIIKPLNVLKELSVIK